MSDQQRASVRDLTPQEVARGLEEGRIVLVDVREPNETALERFPGAVLVPLSAFDPAAIPAPPGARSCLPAAPAAAR
jgi:rhodanese-related sulfurtransferase